MNIIRSKCVSRIFAMITGVVFFNMGMILVEVSALKLDKDQTLIENIAKQIAGCSSEEETDSMSGLADEDVKAKEIKLFGFPSHIKAPAASSLSQPASLLDHQGVPRFGNYEIFCPPPEA